MGTLGNLDIGDFVYDPLTYIDKSKQGGSEGFKKMSDCIRWKVIGKNHDGNNTVTLQVDTTLNMSPDIATFDVAEPTNPNSDRVTNGNSRYAYSNVLQALNSDVASNWYTAKHTYDAVGKNNNYPAFLYRFSSQLKSALTTFSKKTYIPYVDAGNNTTSENVSAKVQLLSVKEVFGDTITNVLDEGTQYEYYQNQTSIYNIDDLRSAKYDGTAIDASYVESNVQNYGSKVRNPAMAGNASHSRYTPIIVLSSSTQVSDDKYWINSTYGSNNNGAYALINMPLIVQATGFGNFQKAEGVTTKTIKYTIYDDNASISSLKIAMDSVENVVYSTTTIIKGNEYTYNVDISGYDINDTHTYYVIAKDANNVETTTSGTIKRINATPIIKIKTENNEWGTQLYYVVDASRPFPIQLKISDPDNNGDSMFVYFMNYGGSSIIERIGEYTQDGEIQYTISDNVWKTMDKTARYYSFVVTATELIEPIVNYQGTKVVLYAPNISTPAPYVTVESTEIGQKNVAFTVDYTPNTDTLQALTLVTVALDGSTISSINNPIAGSTLTLNITKAMLYNLSIGNHTLTFTVTDDLSQTGTTTVTFTRYNETPNVIIPSDLGRKNVGFDISFGVSDDEGDVSSVKMYLDSTATSPIKEWTDVATGSTLTHTISKETLYGLSLGNHKIYVVAEDEFGYATVDADFTRYNDAPVVTATQDSTVHYDDFDVTYTVTDSEDDTVNLTFKIGEATIATVTDVEKDTTLTQSINISGETYGNKTLSIVATDSQGQTSTTTLDFVISTFPVITAEEIGGKTEAFTSTFTVDDADGDDLSVIATLGLVELVNLSNAPHNTPITLNITSAIFNGLEYGNHTITISVTDSGGATTTENVTFQKRSMPTMTINTPIPHEIDQELVISVTYDNADGTEVVLRALIDGVEVPQEISQDAEQETP